MNNNIKVNFDEITYDDYLNDDVYNIEPKWDVWDGWEYVDSLIENLTKDPESIEIPTEYIDQIVLDEDYMEFDNYLWSINQNMIDKVMEYVEFNHPEFFEDVKVANNEKFYKQNTKTGQDLARNFNNQNWFTNKSVDARKLNQTNTEIKDVLTW